MSYESKKPQAEPKASPANAHHTGSSGKSRPAAQLVQMQDGSQHEDNAAAEVATAQLTERSAFAMPVQRTNEPPASSEVKPFQSKQSNIGLPDIPTPAVRLGAGGLVQRVITPGKKEYKTNRQKVKHQDWGEGTIVGVLGQMYDVNFGEHGKKTIPAKDLDLVKEEEEDTEKKDELNAAEHKAEEQGAIPATLELVAGKAKKKWTMILKGVSGETLARVDEVSENEVKNYIERKNKITKNKAPLKAGEYPLMENPKLVGLLKDAYEKASKERTANEELKKLSEARAQVSKGKHKTIGQGAAMDRLEKLQLAIKRTGPGHVSIMMTKIRLDSPITLMVGGEKREITCLYTQPGNATEIRCYLGNDEGAYQRVHTSLTKANPMSAHTMVQTGSEIGIPAYREGGTRVGFDSQETPGQGIAARTLTIRSKKQCTITDWIQGEDWEHLSKEQREGCMLLANRFNAALDKVLADINQGAANERSVTGINAGFKILDDQWLFGKKAATPERELAHSKEEKGGKKEKKSSKDQEHATTSTGLTSSQEIEGGGSVTPGITEFRTWEDARFTRLRKDQRIRITHHQYDISDRIFRVTEDYDPSNYESVPETPPIERVHQ